MLDVAPPWALSGLDYVAPPPVSSRGEPPPPLRHDHAPVSHRSSNLSPLSGELVEGDDLVYVRCTGCAKEYEGDARFLKCPFCGLSQSVDNAPPWAVADGELVSVQTVVAPASAPSRPPPPLPRRPSSQPPPPPPRAPASGALPPRRGPAPPAPPSLPPPDFRTPSKNNLVVAGVAAVVALAGAAFYLLEGASSHEPPRIEIALAPPPPSAIDLDQVQRQLEGITADEQGLGCADALRRYGSAAQNLVPEVPDGVYLEVLNDTGYIESCRIPKATSVDVCAAILNGRAVGVTVTTTPSDPVLDACVAVRVRELRFPAHARVQLSTAKFVPIEEEDAEDAAEAPAGETSAVDDPLRPPAPAPDAPARAADPPEAPARAPAAPGAAEPTPSPYD